MELENLGCGVWAAPAARIIDRSGRKLLPIGRDGFMPAMRESVLVDKTMLIADVLDSGYTATLFCRPRRFGKTLNLTMLKAFLEAPEAGGLSSSDAEALFKNTEVWDACDSFYRQYLGTYPVVSFSLRTAKGNTWRQSIAALRALITAEYQRHDYLLASGTLPTGESGYFERIMSGEATDDDYVSSLLRLTRALRNCHGRPVVVLIDEYDAPVMAGHTNGYYDDVVGFLKSWLTGALKDGGEALAFACLTGVQRISKESIFSDLNNIYVSTALSTDFDERYGFTDAEVEALATYLGHPDCMPEARAWYDGYRFGNVDVYNPWSVLNYLRQGCKPGSYWANTSGNTVVGELVSHADAETMEQVYGLLEPGGTVYAPLDLGIVFPELGVRGDAIWSMLYLAGYLTTDDVEDPSDEMRMRPLRIPDREVARVFRAEIIRRFRTEAGSAMRLAALQRSLVAGDTVHFELELSRIVVRASYHDLTSELPCHMLLMGLLFDVRGYEDPTSNREEGFGRYDIRLEPNPQNVDPRPLVTVEVKYQEGADEDELRQLASKALVQIADKGYDAELPPGASGRLRWGVAFCGKRVAVACKKA